MSSSAALRVGRSARCARMETLRLRAYDNPALAATLAPTFECMEVCAASCCRYRYKLTVIGKCRISTPISPSSSTRSAMPACRTGARPSPEPEGEREGREQPHRDSAQRLPSRRPDHYQLRDCE